METIYTYTRTQAIADGVLVDVTKTAKEAGITVPVAVTQSVWADYILWTEVDNKHAIQDTDGRLWDVLWMLSFAMRTKPNEHEILYELYVVPRDNSRNRTARLTQLKAVIAGGDNGEPVITIMLPGED